jgi:hypothetical protein
MVIGLTIAAILTASALTLSNQAFAQPGQTRLLPGQDGSSGDSYDGGVGGGGASGGGGFPLGQSASNSGHAGPSGLLGQTLAGHEAQLQNSRLCKVVSGQVPLPRQFGITWPPSVWSACGLH